MRTIDKVLLESKAWRQEKLSLDKDYFSRLNNLHTPNMLWISCTDSLASIRDITNTEPGDIIVYQNIGAQIKEDDISLMAVLEEAIEVFNVELIIICGYSHCSGIRNVLDGKEESPALKEWLKDLKSLHERHWHTLKHLGPGQREKSLSELNIRQQVLNLSKLPVVKKAWRNDDYPKIYGCYFDLATGTLKDVFSLERNHQLKQAKTLTENNTTPS